ncbi:MAG: hypothetical protein NTY37_10840 [Methanothrix sp.]|nr:hypothetical protein [Methanothrix sp.]
MEKHKNHIDNFLISETPLKTFVLELIKAYRKYENHHQLISVTFRSYLGVILSVFVLFIIEYAGIDGPILLISKAVTTLLFIFLAVNFVTISSKNIEE